MLQDTPAPGERMDLALARIAEEKRERTGHLSLTNLGLRSLPDALFELTHLRSLTLGGSHDRWRITEIKSEQGWIPTDKPFNPNRLDFQSLDLSVLDELTALDLSGLKTETAVFVTYLSRLETLDISFSKIRDLSFLHELNALSHLDCSDTRVNDLSPLRGLNTLSHLHCFNTQITDLSPLQRLGALSHLNCSYTPVANLSALRGLNTLSHLHCFNTQVTDLSPLQGLGTLFHLNCSHTPITNLSPLRGLNSLSYLDCSSTQVSDLSPLRGLNALSHVDCSFTRITDLSPLQGLNALSHVDCSFTRITDLSPLQGLNVLSHLGCSHTQIADLFPLQKLSSLSYLDCSVTRVADLSPLQKLNALSHLNCLGTQVADISPLHRFKALSYFNCSGTQISDFSLLQGLHALSYFDCSTTRVTDLSFLRGLNALSHLECARTRISDLSALQGLHALSYLNCPSTQVTDLSPLQELNALFYLDCSYTQIIDLSPLHGLNALSQLHCFNTPVSDLSPLQKLNALFHLDCSDTQVIDLSPLRRLSTLESLGCYGAPITELPRWLTKIPNLNRLAAGNSDTLNHIPAEVLSQSTGDNCLHRLRDHYADLDQAEPLHDVKLLILGNGRIGKTQICRRLRGEAFEEDADSTHGVTVHTQAFPLPGDEKDAQLNVWDFGGQDIYHGTHALFLRTRAVFLIVWTPDSETGESRHGGLMFRNQPLAYWLDYVRHFGGVDCPVLIVQNQCDGGRGQRLNLPVKQEHLAPLEADGRFIRTLAYSARDNHGRTGLEEALQTAILELRERHGMPTMGANRLAVWRQLQAWRNADADRPEAQREHRLLPYDRFQALCDEHEVHGPETFVEVLHHAGVVYFRPDLFDRHLVLDQSWALEKIYALFHRQAVYRPLQRWGGRFTRRDLHDLLWEREGLSEPDQESLLGMMQSSGVCFVHRHENEDGETEYVAPELLPEGREAVHPELAARWDAIPGEPLAFEFRYPFLTPAISRTVLSDLGDQIGKSALYWRFGVCIYEAQTGANAIVEQSLDADGYGGVIRIEAKGRRPGELLRLLAARIHRLNQHLGYVTERVGDLPEVAKANIEREKNPSLNAALPPNTRPDPPEVFISYHWDQDACEPLVDDLRAALNGNPYKLVIDKHDLPVGDRISHFMDRLGEGRCIVVVVSAGYLRSESCLYELYHIWWNSKHDGKAFLKRVVPLVQDGADIGSPAQRIRHAAHWRKQYQEIETLIRENGSDGVGEEDFHHHRLLGEYQRHIGDMLALLNDRNVPRDSATLRENDFRVVRDLIERAIA